MSEARPSRRQHPRYNVDVQVAVSVAKQRFDAHTRDVSRAGLCLVAAEPIARDTEVQLELVLTFGDDGMSEPLEILGRVAWCTALFGRYQIGVKFVKVDDERAKYLDMFVGFLDGTLATGGMLSDAEPDDGDGDASPTSPALADPDDPFAA
jgi:hypothetical protein